jgi:hypothetical protein
MTDVIVRKGAVIRDVFPQKKSHVRTQQEGCYLHAEEAGLSRNTTCQDLDLGLPASRTVETNSVV